MKYIAQHFKNDKLKQSLLNEIAVRQIKKNGINNITELENIYNTYVTDPTLRAAYKTEYDKWNIAVAGKLSPDFEAKDINGKTYSLKDFKGKYLFLGNVVRSLQKRNALPERTGKENGRKKYHLPRSFH